MNAAMIQHMTGFQWKRVHVTQITVIQP